MRVLVTDGGHKNTLSIIRYLSLEGHEVSIIHNKRSAPAFSRYCKNLFISPSIYETETYIGFLTDLVMQNEFDVLIPVGAETYSILSPIKEKIRPFTKFVIAEPEQINLALNKTKTYKFAEEIGIAHPKTIYPNSLDEAIIFSETLIYPVVVKPPLETVKKFPVQYFENHQTLVKYLPGIYNLLKNMSPIIQEKITGTGYGFYAVYNNGLIQQSFMHRRIREFPVKGGISTCAESYYNNNLYLTGKKILDELKWHGPAMVEFKKDHLTGNYFLIEINPKFWGSLDLSMVAGLNFPDIICKIANNELVEQKNYESGIIFQWLFSSGGEFYRLKEKPLDIWKVLGCMFSGKSKNDFWIRDPMPNFKQVTDYLAGWCR